MKNKIGEYEKKRTFKKAFKVMYFTIKDKFVFLIQYIKL